MKSPKEISKAQKITNAWGMKKYPDSVEGTTFRVETETRSDGYCDTCWYEYQAVIVYATAPGEREKEIAELSTSMGDLLNEMLEDYVP